MMKPLIGVTSSQDKGDCPDTYFSGKMYSKAVIAAGGIPVILPITDDRELIAELAARIDGLLLIGGVDIDPRLYGEEPHPKLGRIDSQRDYFELELVKLMFEYKKAIFGICRGSQILNIAFGGTLYQDIAGQFKNEIKHTQDGARWYPTHTVEIKGGGTLAQAFPAGKAEVNSYHHQSIKEIAPGFMVAALAPDGVVEALECIEHPHIFGVQWHPEHLWQRDQGIFKLFQYFVAQARPYHK